MNIDSKLMQEADALGLTIQELLDLKRNAVDSEEAHRRGIELCELRMRQRGASEESIENERAKINQKIKNILQL